MQQDQRRERIDKFSWPAILYRWIYKWTSLHIHKTISLPYSIVQYLHSLDLLQEEGVQDGTTSHKQLMASTQRIGTDEYPWQTRCWENRKRTKGRNCRLLRNCWILEYFGNSMDIIFCIVIEYVINWEVQTITKDCDSMRRRWSIGTACSLAWMYSKWLVTQKLECQSLSIFTKLRD